MVLRPSLKWRPPHPEKQPSWWLYKSGQGNIYLILTGLSSIRTKNIRSIFQSVFPLWNQSMLKYEGAVLQTPVPISINYRAYVTFLYCSSLQATHVSSPITKAKRLRERPVSEWSRRNELIQIRDLPFYPICHTVKSAISDWLYCYFQTLTCLGYGRPHISVCHGFGISRWSFYGFCISHTFCYT